MNEPAGPTDAELVMGVLAADRDAFAAVYDRYGDKLYDFAHSMLRQREDAADAVADSFVIAAERMHQLREADRLRPWLYAIVRSQCLRTLKARKRVAFGGDEQLVAMADSSLTPDQEAERAAARQIVWDAAAGLAERDRALLDLHLRHGLEGAELGEAMGVSAANAYVMLNRLRGQVDRSLGALLIARLGRDDCHDLDTMLQDWDGTFSPLIRKRVARHVDDCELCAKRRKKFLSPWMLLAGVPMVSAPLSLRDRVVTDTHLVAYTTPTGDPLTTIRGPRKRPKAAITAAAVTVVIAVTGATALLWPGGGDEVAPQADAVVTPTPSPTTPTAATAVPADPTPSPTANTPGTIVLSTNSIALGRNNSSSSVTLTNSGGLAIDYRVTSDAEWVSASPSTAQLEPGASSKLVVRADRSEVREGESTSSIELTWSGGRAAVRVTLREERGPKVGRPTTGPNPSCEVPVQVSVSDESSISSVVLRWSGPSGSDSTTMSRSGSSWTGTMGRFSVGGDVSVRVEAKDSRGNQTTGPAVTFNVDPCPQ